MKASLTTRGTKRKYQLYPELAGLHGKARRNYKERNRRAPLMALGLNKYGYTRRQRIYPELAGLTGRERRNARMRLITRERSLLGYTARGTNRVAWTRPAGIRPAPKQLCFV